MSQKRRNCKNKKIVFMGTPKISTMALKALLDLNYEILYIVSQPDKFSGRNKEIIYSDVKKFAIEKNINLLQPNNMQELFDNLKNINFDYIVTCAYGKFISMDILSLPKEMSINFHASILPRNRGGAPIHWSIINGDKFTGVSWIKMESKMDAGDIFFQKEIPIDINETTVSLTEKIGKLIYETTFLEFDNFVLNKMKPIKQDDSLVTFALNIKRDQEKINWNSEDFKIDRLVRGLYDKPFAFSLLKGKEIKIIKIKLSNEKSYLSPGTISKINKDGIYVCTKNNDIVITNIKIEGKKEIEIKDYINGNKIFFIGNQFS